MPRSTRDEWAMGMAAMTAARSTCLRRAVGCVLLDARSHVLATGFNGVAAGAPHCNEGHPCPGAAAPSGTQLDGCHAVHAEQNALLQCADVQRIAAAYTTTAPCMTCMKLLLNTGCRVIFWRDPYPHAAAAEALWTGAGRLWVRFPR